MGRCHFLGLVLQFGFATCFRSEQLQPQCGDVQLTLDDILYLSTPHLRPGTVFPFGEYCTWTIISPANTKIKLFFENFVLEYHPTCAIDYVTISNGNCDKKDSDGPRFCGVVPPPMSISATNVICLKFASSMYTTEKGFILKAESLTGITGDAITKASVKTADVIIKASVITEDTTTKERVTTEDATIKASITTDKPIVQSNLQTKASSLVHLLTTYNSPLAGLKTTFKTTLGSLNLSVSSAIYLSTTSISSSGKLETIELCNVTGTFLAYNNIFVTSPNFGDNQKYPVNTICTTTFSALVGYKMKIEFIHFDIEGNNLCSWDSLQVFDGADESTKMIKNLCGTSLPDSFISTGNELCFKFVSDNIIPRSGWKAKINIIKVDVNTQPTSTSSSDTNTNFASTVTPMSQSEIDLSTLSSAYRSTRRNDSMASLPSLTTTNHSSSGSIGKTDSTVETIPISLTPSTQPPSFSAFSSTVPAFVPKVAEMCSTNESISVVENFLHLTSPWFDEYSMYPTSILCTVSLRANIGSKLEISFLHFDVEGNSLCSWDSLQIFDGANDTGTLLGKLCGSSLPGSLASTGRYLFLKFVSDEIISKTGFKAKINLVQGVDEKPTTEPGTITSVSPATPKLTTRTSSSLSVITFLHTLYSSISSTHHTKVMFASEFGSTTTILANTPSVSSTSVPSFQAEKIEMCSVEKLTIYKSITVLSPKDNDTGMYPTSIICGLTIISKSSALHIEFEQLDIEYQQYCMWDYLEIYDGPSTTSPLKSRYCGSDIPPPIQTSGKEVSFRFQSDHIIPRSGFKLNISLINNSPGEVTIHGTTKEFVWASVDVNQNKHNYTEAVTPNNQGSTIAVTPNNQGSTIAVTSNNQGSTEYVTPNNQSSTEAVTTKNPDSTEAVTPNNQGSTGFVTPDNQIYTEALTPNKQGSTEALTPNNQGSTKALTPNNQGSTEALTPNNQGYTEALTPNNQGYTEALTPNNQGYTEALTPNNQGYTEALTPNNQGYTEALTPNNQGYTEDLTPNNQGYTEALTPNNQGSTEALTPNNLGSTESVTTNNQSSTDTYKHITTPVTNSTQTTIGISDTQLSTPSLGFGLPQACSGDGMNIRNPSGIIDSPGLQNDKKYPHSVNCTWIILGLTGNRISVHFEAFELEESNNCIKDSVTVFKNSIQDSNLLGRYCGLLEPFEIYTMGETLLIHFTTDEDGSERGFMAKYTIGTPPAKIADCPVWQRACMEGTCISEEWFCDSIEDCAGGEDEANCAICSDTQFQCDYNRCIPAKQRCNGIQDCQDTTDEDFCVSITNINGSLRIMYENKWYPVCGVGWTTALGHALCKMAEYREMASVSFLPLKVNTPMILINSISNIQQNIEISGKCPDAGEVNLICKESGCGIKSKSIRKARVVGGDRSVPGEWPWVVAIRAGEKVTCGGTLISNQWVVTAGHCMASLQDSTHLASVMVGTNNVMMDDSYVVGVTEIVMHPDYEFIYNADLALLRLQRPLVISYNVRPVCLPWDRRRFTNSTLCYIAGWGITDMKDYYTTTAPEYLHHARTKIWRESDCRKVYSSKVKDSMFCAGYKAGGIDACKGDSGGPLMCKMEDNRWVLTGVTSWGEKCGQLGFPGVYTDVASYLDWIDSVMGYIVVNVSCDFESVNICGYLEMSNGSFLWTRRPGGFSSDIKPSVDATNGVNGHYVFAEVSPGQTCNNNQAVLLSPPISGDTQKCLRFAFMFSGRSDLVLSVYGHRGDYNETGLLEESELLWVMRSEFGTWRRSKTSLPDSVTHVAFVVTLGIKTNVGVALDDVFFESSSCADQDAFRCSFDDGTLCRYQQATDDYLDWVLQSTATEAGYKVIPKSSWSGYYLEFGGSQIARGDKATILSTTINDSLPHCLNMYYKIYPRLSGSLSVILRVEFGDMHVYGDAMWTTRESRMSTWTWVAVDLPSRMYGFRVAIQGKRESYTGDFEILVDDVYIYEGNCKVTNFYV